MSAYLYRNFEGQFINERYYLNRFIDAGGNGGVFEAHEVIHDQFYRKVAIKLVHKNDDISDIQLREVKLAEQFRHHCIVQTYSTGQCDIDDFPFLFLVMELADGSLDDEIKKKQLTVEQIAKIIQHISTALIFLHAQGKVHRDLKPGNVLKFGDKYKLADFGIVRELRNNPDSENPQRTYTLTQNIQGTYLYLSPESVKDNIISPSLDVWSLGILIIQLITGKIPYGDFQSDFELLTKINKRNLEIPQLSPEYSIFNEVIDGCLRKNRKKRLTAKDVLDSISRVYPRYSTLKSRNIDCITFKEKHSFNINDIGTEDLGSEYFGENYYKNLRDILISGDFRAANKETQEKLCMITSRQNEGWLRPSDIKNIPLIDLNNIDRLWVKYSQGRFGFSIQKEIWEAIQSDWDKFTLIVGWKKYNGGYKHQHNDAPVGYFPAIDMQNLEWGGFIHGTWSPDPESLTAMLEKFVFPVPDVFSPRMQEKWQSKSYFCEGIFYFEKGEYKQSISCFKKANSAGHPEANQKLLDVEKRYNEVKQKIISGKDLNSEISYEYADLEYHLEYKNWRAANRATRRLLRSQQIGTLKSTQDCLKLCIIDSLWKEHSNGSFGFSAQLKIWHECGCPSVYNKDWEKFGHAVDWKNSRMWPGRAAWYKLEQLTYDGWRIPVGHLPCLHDNATDLGELHRDLLIFFNTCKQNI
jgi:serine/threonine protein kinase